MRLRRAEPEDCAALSALAMASKAHWGYDDAFMAACREVLTVRPDRLANNVVEVAEADGELVGFFELENGYGLGSVEKLFVAPQWIGKGIGRLLWNRMIDLARAAGTPALEVESDPDAEPFYKAMGMRRVGDRPSEAIAGRRLPFLTGFVPGSVLGRVSSLDFKAGAEWDYPTQNATAIAEEWTRQTAANPALYDGRMLICVDWSFEGGRLSGRLAEIPYAAFIHWRNTGCPDRTAANVFGSAVVMSADGAMIMGRMAAHTSNADLIYPFAGSLEPADVDASGTVQVRASAVRELAEESGLDAARATRGDPLAIRDGPRLSIAYLFRFPETADQLTAKIEAELARQVRPEVSEVVVVRGRSDIDVGRMPGYTQALIVELLD